MKAMRNLILVAVAALLALPFACAQQTQAPSLGEVAKQKPVKKAKKVFTEDDLPTSGAGVTSAAATSSGSGAASTPQSAAGAGPGGETGAGEKGEATAAKPSSEEVEAAKQRAEQLARDEAGMARKYKKLEDDLATETNPFRREVLQRELANSTANMAAVRKQREEAEAIAAGKAKAKPAEQPPQEAPKP